MSGVNPSAVVVALSTVVAVSTVGFMVSVLGTAGGANATLPIPGITGSAAPVADEVPGPPAVQVGPGASDDAPGAENEHPIEGETPPNPSQPNQSTPYAGGSGVTDPPATGAQPGGGSPSTQPEPVTVPPPPAAPVTPPKPAPPPASEPGKPEHANPGNGANNGNGPTNGNGQGANGTGNKP